MGHDFDTIILINGKYAGKRITQIPVSYLRWMVNNKHPQYNSAIDEMKRRGTVIPELEVSGHAIDRASLRCWGEYQKGRKKKEGLYAWLERMSRAALKKGNVIKDGKINYKNMIFVFTQDTCWPVLQTIINRKKNVKSGGVRCSSPTPHIFTQDHPAF